MSRSFKYILSAAIIIFWVLMLLFLVLKEFLPLRSIPYSLTIPQRLPYCESWDVLADNKPIGRVESVFDKHPEEGYLISAQADIKFVLPIINVFFKEKPDSIKNIRLKSYFHILPEDNNSRIGRNTVSVKDFNIDIEAYGVNINIRGCVRGNILYLYYRDGAGEKAYREKVRIKVVDEALYFRGDKSVKAAVVEMNYQGAVWKYLVNQEGRLVKVITPWGWEFVRLND